METFQLRELHLKQHGSALQLHYEEAQLAVVTEAGSRLWYIDVNGVGQTELLQKLSDNGDDLRFELIAVTADGLRFEGVGYLHPNVKHQAAAIRGDGELIGY
jgi:hypothetical protein